MTVVLLVVGLLVAGLVLFLNRGITYDKKTEILITHRFNSEGKLVETRVGTVSVPHGFGSSQVKIKVNVVKDQEVSQKTGGRLLKAVLQGNTHFEGDSDGEGG